MSIHDIRKKINYFLWSVRQEKVAPFLINLRANFNPKDDLFLILIITSVGLCGFGLGRLSAFEKGRGPITISSPTISEATPKVIDSVQPASKSSDALSGKLLVASKNGNKYHFPWCSGALRISEANKIWFSSYDEARTAGYSAASNCPGLK